MTDNTEPTAASIGTWPQLLRITAVVGAVYVGIVIVLGAPPPLLIFAVIWLAGTWVVPLRANVGAALLLFGFFFFLVPNLPYVALLVPVPESWVDFNQAMIATGISVVGIIAGIAVLRRAPLNSTMPRAVGSAAIVTVLTAAGWSAYTTLTYDEPEPLGGDSRLVAEDSVFSSRRLQEVPGRMGLYVDNQDLVLHTFTIEELDIDVMVPGGKAVRAVLSVPRGRYEFFCRTHPSSMRGILEVAPLEGTTAS